MATHTHTVSSPDSRARENPNLNVKNRTLFHGDNLKFLQGINTGCIDLIYADPPFNKNRDFYSDPESLAGGGGFEDRWRWEKDVHDDWVESIRNDRPGVHAVIEAAKLAYGIDMAAFLCWLGVRVMECHRVLNVTGSMFLHIDHTAHAWVKCMMDDIFGKRNFRNEIVWFYDDAPGRSIRYFPRKHDTVLWYSKSDRWTFNADAVRVPIKAASVERYRTARVIGGRSYVGGASAEKGKVPEDVWPMPVVKKNKTNKESAGYPTQKPLRLLRRIVTACSDEGDMVLDPFCGCATTPIAAEHLGRQWVGMDIWDKAHDTVLNRLAAEGLAVPDGEYKGQADLIPFGEVVRTTDVPIRTDDMKVAVADFELERQVPLERWEKLKTREMRDILASVQAGAQELVVCAGCGRQLEPEFMELDHNHPKSLGGENVITNRMLLCRPCNGYKGNKDTVAGLWSTNKQSGWMKDGNLAEITYHGAVRETQNVKKRLRGTS